MNGEHSNAREAPTTDQCPKCGSEVLKSPTLGKYHVCGNPLDVRQTDRISAAMDRLRAHADSIGLDGELNADVNTLRDEIDRLRTLLDQARGSIEKAADTDCVCVDGPQRCKYCHPHRALLEQIDAALSTVAKAEERS